MAQILVRFVTSQSAVSSLIRFFSHAPKNAPSHVEFGLPDSSWLGAHDDGGVQIRPFNYYTPTWERRYAIPCTDAEYAKVMGFAKAQIGKPYDFVDIAGILLDQNWHSIDKWDCSGLVTASLMQVWPVLNIQTGYSFRISPDVLHLAQIFYGKCVYSFPTPLENAA